MEKITIKPDARGLVPAVVQDAKTGEVLMLAYVNQGSLRRTMDNHEAWFYSRSREELWHKGEVSGNSIKVQSIAVDCDGDALLFRAEPTGPACHTGEKTCFFRDLTNDNYEFAPETGGAGIMEELAQVIAERKASMPEGSYTVSLFKEGVERVAQKVIEEAGETAIAGVKQTKERLVSEVADLWFHSLVLLASRDVSLEEVWEELRKRRK